MPLFESKTVVVEKNSDGSAVLKIDVPGRTHNTLGRQLLGDLDAALDRLAGEKSLPLLQVLSGKPAGFLAGAELGEFLDVTDVAAAEALSARGQKLFDKLAALPFPTVAVIHGPCLGGGLELSLACDYRLVLDMASTQLGFPEVQLGLLPAWGGTQRLPRVVGLTAALDLILTARRVGAPQALKLGLADAAAPSDKAERLDSLHRLEGRALADGKRPLRGLPLRTWFQRLVESNPLGRRLLFQQAEVLVKKTAPDDMPAPSDALEAIRVGVKQGMEAGLAYERAAAGRLAQSPASRNLIGLFLRQEQARKMPAALQQAKPPEVQRVGVVGAGVMGAGIAQLAALRGCKVVVREVNAEALGAGVVRIKGLIDKAVERRVITEAEAAKAFTAVTGTTQWDGFADADLVVEAAVEELDAKRAIFRELDGRTRPSAVLATNTSSLRVAALQDGLAHPERVGGLHFFNPVHKMPLVEVVRTPATTERALAALVQTAIKLGKTPVVVGDGPGFVVNRVLTPYLNEATLLVAEGMAGAEIDAAMRRFGMPMGPLELLDQIGLDVAAHVARSLGPVLEGRFGANPAFEKMREKGWLGQKSGRGFYTHRGKKLSPNHLAENLLRADPPAGAALSRALPTAVRLSEARERLVLLMVNEAALVLAEGLAADADTIDLAMILGTGWAPHRGGPLRYADDRGLGAVAEALAALAERHGPRFAPCAELERRAESATRFTPPSVSGGVNREGAGV
jgi:3-hydroxyacyl-CoA dehydrogenase/enoyl-CoA hydratase/3-hydroxybutyryl-CoA epimerase